MIALICLSAPAWVPFALLGLFRAVWLTLGLPWIASEGLAFAASVIGVLIGFMIVMGWWADRN